MWHFMEECCDWYAELGMQVPSGTRVLNHPLWDWITVACFTCEASCDAGGAAWSVCEEHVAAFNGLEGHVAQATELMDFLGADARTGPPALPADAVVDSAELGPPAEALEELDM